MSTQQRVGGRTGEPVARAAIERVVDLARMAPSIHNTQPWSWYAGPRLLQLRADRSRSLARTDPHGRGLVISCGASLHHAVVTATAMGLAPVVEHAPVESAPDLLARIHLRPGAETATADSLLDAITERCTDRRRFTSWPVPHGMLAHLVAMAGRWGASVSPVSDPAARRQVEVLTERARAALVDDPAVVEETLLWLDHGDHDGIPRQAVPPRVAGAYPHRFDPTPGPDLDDTRVTVTDDLMVISTAGDHTVDWLHAGEALSALWLEATRLGLSVVPLSEAIEYDACRDALRSELGLRDPEPQLLLRIGWQQIGRSSLRRTPRRPLDEVLHPLR